MTEGRVLRDHNVDVAKDSVRWRRSLRLLQALWREEHGWPAGSPAPGARSVGSCLAADEAERLGWNFLTHAIFARARHEVDTYGSLPGSDPRHKVLKTPRLFNNLLSSQPLCFNLFAELDEDRQLASVVARRLWPGIVDEVRRIEFEWSPGRANPKYLDNRSAFDVFIEHTTPSGGRGFLGIEVKYHEDLKNRAGDVRGRARQVATQSGVFMEPDSPRMTEAPLNQLFLDHLLALSMLESDDGWETGRFVFAYPAVNAVCHQAVGRYEDCLVDVATFEALTLEKIIDAILAASSDDWPREFRRRYLDYSRTLEVGFPPVDVQPERG